MVKKHSELFLIPLLAGLVFFDQLTKFIARDYMVNSIPVIKNFLHLTFVMNSGVAFGFLQGTNDIFVWLYIVVLGLIVFFYDKFPKDRFCRVMLFFIIAGVAGNFIDRIVFGYVVDFIDLRIWPVFNVADIYLVVGIVGIIGRELFKKKK